MEDSNKYYCRLASEFSIHEFLDRVKAKGGEKYESFEDLISLINNSDAELFVEDARWVNYWNYGRYTKDDIGAIEAWYDRGIFDRELAIIVNDVFKEMGFIRTNWKEDPRIDAIFYLLDLQCFTTYFEIIYEKEEYETHDIAEDETKIRKTMALIERYLPPMQYSIFRFHVFYGHRLFYNWDIPRPRNDGYTEMEVELLKKAIANLKRYCKEKILHIFCS